MESASKAKWLAAIARICMILVNRAGSACYIKLYWANDFYGYAKAARFTNVVYFVRANRCSA